MDLPFEALTHSAEETESVGAALADALRADSSLPRFIAMYGDLGVGKTAFTRGFASVLAPNSAVRSPTFAIVNEYRGEGHSVYHFDMYRIADEDDLYSVGFYDYIEGKDYCIAEWCENIPYALPDERIEVRIEKTSADAPDERRIVCLTAQ